MAELQPLHSVTTFGLVLSRSLHLEMNLRIMLLWLLKQFLHTMPSESSMLTGQLKPLHRMHLGTVFSVAYLYSGSFKSSQSVKC